jgi:hypothetical protein
MLMQCRDRLRHEEMHVTSPTPTEEGEEAKSTLPEDKLVLDANEKADQEYSQLDGRLRAFIHDMSFVPYWASGTRVSHGSQLLLGNIITVVHGLICGAGVAIACSSEGAALIAAVAAAASYRDLPTVAASSVRTHASPEELLGSVTPSTAHVDACVSKWIRSLYICIRSIAINGIVVEDECMHQLIGMRMEFAVTRRLVLSVCGVGWWDDSLWGMPLSEDFLLFCLKVCAVASIKSLQRVSETLSDQDIDDVIHLW